MDKIEIRTDKIKLKIVDQIDIETLHALRTNSEVAKFINRDLEKSISDMDQFIQKTISDPTMLFFKIETLNEARFVGTICLKNIDLQNKYAEVGYELFPDFQEKGFMSEALDQIINFGFLNLKIEKLEAYTHHQNVRSRKLLEKFEFKLTDKIDPQNLNNVVYKLNKASI